MLKSNQRILNQKKSNNPTGKNRKTGGSRDARKSREEQIARKNSIQTLYAAGRVQAHLKVGATDDQYEREANKVADLVVGMSKPRGIAGSIESRGSGNQPPTVRRMKGGAKSSQTGTSTLSLPGMPSSRGKPLSRQALDFFEPRFQTKFDHVRIHTGEQAHLSARSIDARAFTAGNHIVMANGEYNSDSREGKHLLAHELTHTIQQGGNRQTAAPIQRSPKSKTGGSKDFIALLRATAFLKSVSKASSALLIKLGQAGAGVIGAAKIVALAEKHGLVESIGDSRDGASYVVSTKNKSAISSGLAHAFGGQKFIITKSGELKMSGPMKGGSGGSGHVQRQVIQRAAILLPAGGAVLAMKMIGALILAAIIVIGLLLFIKWVSELEFTIPDTIPERKDRPVPDTRPRAEDKKKKKKKESTKEKDDKKTDPSKNPDEDKKKKRPGHDGGKRGGMNSMRFQVQWGSGKDRGEFGEPATAPSERGVTASEAVAKLELAWSQVTPKKAKEASFAAKEHQIRYINSIPPEGITGRTSNSEYFKYKNFNNARVDVENLHGHNLRFP